MRPVSFKRHRLPAEVIRHAVWLYFRFTLSFRDVEEMLAERGIDISYETILGPEVRLANRAEQPAFRSQANRPGRIWMRWS
jgi:transposase-like protein